MLLARSDRSPQRFYGMSSQIRKERNKYYEILERTQKGNLEITPWLLWFLNCLLNALTSTESVLANVLFKSDFWARHSGTSLNERQRAMLNRLIDGIEGHLTTSKWAKMTECSQDIALRDIQDLIEKDILTKDPRGGRSTHYHLK